MATFYCNTKELKTCGQDIVSLADDFMNIIDTIFNRIGNINTRSDGWIGEDADKYVEQVLKEKQIYNALYENLKQFGLAFEQTADTFDNTIRKIDASI